MPKNLFIGTLRAPTERDLNGALGTRKGLWDQLVREVVSQCGAATQEWNSYSTKAGWSLRIKEKARVIVHLSPCDDCVLASFALGSAAIAQAKSRDLPAAIQNIIRKARTYAEGTAVRVPVRAAEEIPSVIQLVAIKRGC